MLQFLHYSKEKAELNAIKRKCLESPEEAGGGAGAKAPLALFLLLLICGTFYLRFPAIMRNHSSVF